MSDILRRIIEAQKSDENPFFKDAEGRIIELTAYQGEVFTGYYQADSDIYYTERDWLEYQRQLELDRITEEEYKAEQERLAAQRAERERKRALLEAQEKKEQDKVKKGKSLKKPQLGKKFLFGTLLVAGLVVVSILFWPTETTISETNEPDVLITDTIQEEAPSATFGNAIITGNDVRMRSEPNLKGTIVTYFPKEGERVLLLQAVSDTLLWARVQRENGTEGWVFGDYVKEK